MVSLIKLVRMIGTWALADDDAVKIRVELSSEMTDQREREREI